jgi:interferon-induced GTP-binding protein Mx1
MPQICVMGDQSSGKSSVLEALSGIPFPRGSGLVTRCPIRMVMKRARSGESWSAVVSTTANPALVNARDVPDLNLIIDRKMTELCGGASNFSTESVVVELVSPDACDLTVVDLPGIIRTITAGQNITVVEQVNRLIKSYLMDKRTIILAVIPANQDIATVDILERAQSVDPTGQRTIGVLTKTDLVGPGNEEEVLAVVNNVRKPLNLGYVIVKNRSQKEIVENVSATKARYEACLRFPTFYPLNSYFVGITRLHFSVITQFSESVTPI